MGELRRDYFRDRYVIINPERARRPDNFNHANQLNSNSPGMPSPFAPGNEHKLPPILATYPKTDTSTKISDSDPAPLDRELNHNAHEASNDTYWQYRVVANKFAIAKPEGNPQLQTANELFTWSSNYGEHEVVIEGREDNIPFHALGPDGIAQAIAVAVERIKHMHTLEHINYVAYFKNEGRDAGASINHPHSQIIATAIVPPSVKELTNTFEQLRAQWGFSPLYKVLDYERGGPRIAAETKHFVALCPYASRFPMELLIVPVRDSETYTSLTDEERLDLGHLLHRLLGRLASISSPYNIEWFHSQATSFHWHLRITPRLSIWAGYELETNIIVNPIPPENAAAFYCEAGQ